MACLRSARALYLAAAGVAGADFYGVRAAGHVGVQMQMGAQSGGMEVFFRRNGIPGQAAGQGCFSVADKEEVYSGGAALPCLKNDEPKEKEAEKRKRWQCAICGKWWSATTASRRSCSSCGGPSFEDGEPVPSLGPSRSSRARQSSHGPDSQEHADRARPVMDFMDEEKVVWGVSQQRAREGGR